MRTKKEIIDYWLPIISNDYMHFDSAGLENARKFADVCQIQEYDDRGVMMWATIRDIDNVVKTNVVLFYIKPEYRGSTLFLTMIKNLETISIKDGAKEIFIGVSVSGYKEEKFNKIFQRFGYTPSGFKKKV